MSTNKYAVTGIVVALVLGIASVLGFQIHLGSSSLVGSIGNQYAENYIPLIRLNGGYNSQLPIQTSGSVTSASDITGAFSSSGDATVGGGTLNVTTSNTATSTVIAGCYQFYATSTATAQKFQASTTPGVMVSQYGACPTL